MMYRPTPPDRKPCSKLTGWTIILLVGAMSIFVGLNCGPIIAWLLRIFREAWTFTQ